MSIAKLSLNHPRSTVMFATVVSLAVLFYLYHFLTRLSFAIAVSCRVPGDYAFYLALAVGGAVSLFVSIFVYRLLA